MNNCKWHSTEEQYLKNYMPIYLKYCILIDASSRLSLNKSVITS